MKLNTLYSSIACVLASAAATQAAITFQVDQTGGGGGSSIFNLTTGGWDFEEDGPWANAYYDGNNNGVFGEGGASGDTSGDTNASLNVSKVITDGLVMNFAVEGFTGAADLGSTSFRFNVEKTDASVETITANEGAETNFTDSNGDQWKVAYAFTAQAYGDVVSNLASTPGGTGGSNDHQATLTFTQVPEPSALGLAGLAGLGLLARRRR